MEVSAVRSASQPIVVQQSQELSSTDWKVYAKVVLSYLLIGIGLALACSSPFIAFTINPMVAAAAPLTPIVAGVLLQNPPIKTKPKEPSRPLNISNPPIGIANKSGNCWINASLQLLFNVPAYKQMLEKLPTSSVLGGAYKTYKEGGAVDSQKIRKWLHERNRRDISLDPSQQLSFDLCLMPILKEIGYALPREINHRIVWKDKGANVSRVSPIPDPSFDLTFAFKEDNPSNDVSQALKSYFYISEDGPGQKFNTLVTWDKEPKDFGFSLNFTAFLAQKSDKKLSGALQVSLGEEFGKDSNYSCDGFILHQGSSGQYGHYVAYILKEGTWWEISDSTAKPLPRLRDVEKLLAKASFIHYQRKTSEISS